MSPKPLYRTVARIEAVTWAALIIGLGLKYGTGTTDVVVRVSGMVHGAAFLAYCVVTTFVAVDQKWGSWRWLLGVLTVAVFAVPALILVGTGLAALRLLNGATPVEDREPAPPMTPARSRLPHR